jgi:uncharacterized membrane protein YhiD involved in acid resistance
MNRVRTAILIGVGAVLVLMLGAPALATESQTDSTTTTVATDTTQPGEQPAVVIPDVPPEEEKQPWTSRFLYPTIVALTIILIVGTLIGYNRTIRHRYKVVS